MMPTVCFIACHAGPAEHFAAFADELSKDHKVRIWAGPAARQQFGEHEVTTFDEMDEASAKRIADACQDATYVITDLGHPFDILLQQALAQFAPNVKRFCYYDNPEIEVPGDYSQLANEVMSLTQHILIANAEIAKNEAEGIGYYPIQRARKLNGLRLDVGERKRAEYFHHIGMKDSGQKICLYLGGNNREFYEEAFPTFCKMAPNDPNTLFVCQPHPSSHQLDLPDHVRLSDWTTEEMLVVAQLVLYYQTSLAPLVAFAGIPIIQVGKRAYHDLLNRSGVGFASTEEELKLEMESTTKRLYPPSLVGFRQDWPERLRQALQLNN